MIFSRVKLPIRELDNILVGDMLIVEFRILEVDPDPFPDGLDIAKNRKRMFYSVYGDIVGYRLRDT